MSSRCQVCASLIDDADNFCRRCGASLAVRLPAVRSNPAAMIWQPAASPVVRGAAVMAAGTIGQFLLRRAVTGLISGGRERARRAIPVGRSRNDGMVDEAQIITETLMMRRVRVRRQA